MTRANLCNHPSNGLKIRIFEIKHLRYENLAHFSVLQQVKKFLVLAAYNRGVLVHIHVCTLEDLAITLLFYALKIVVQKAYLKNPFISEHRILKYLSRHLFEDLSL